MRISIKAQWWIVGAGSFLLCMASVECVPPNSARQAPIRYDPVQPSEELADISADGGVASRRGIPPRPADWQKRPPCSKEMGEHEVNGACYFRIYPDDMKPPCLSPALEHNGFCWRAIAKATRIPSSIGTAPRPPTTLER